VAIVVKNYWGMADNVEVTLEAQADGAVAGPDPVRDLGCAHREITAA
jgi:hypothetical protein